MSKFNASICQFSRSVSTTKIANFVHFSENKNIFSTIAFVLTNSSKTDSTIKDMKPTLAADEMFPEGAGFMDLEESGSSSGILMDLATNEKHVHADFYNDFEDLFDDDDDLALNP